MDSQGVFYETPESSGTPGVPLPDLSVQNYTPTYDKDKLRPTRRSTINGRIGDLKLVYTGGYLVRNIEQQGDYTNYARGVYADYYQCTQPVRERQAQAASAIRLRPTGAIASAIPMTARSSG